MKFSQGSLDKGIYSVEEAKTNDRPQVSLNGGINISCFKMCPLPRRHLSISGWRKNRHFICGGPMAIFFSFLDLT